MAKPITYRGLPTRYSQMLTKRYFNRGRVRNPTVSLTDRIAKMLIEKRLPEKVLDALQNPKVNQRQRNKLIQHVLLDNYHISRVFGIKELSSKNRQVVFRTLYTNALQVLEARGKIRINPRTGVPIPLSAQKTAQLSPSYIGVCDVPNKRLATALLHDFIKHNTNPNRKFMIGVMTHPIVLNPDLPVPPSVRKEITQTFPKSDCLANGFIDNPNVLNTIHYADLYGPKGPRGAQEAPNILKNLELCVKYGGKKLNAIQLDVTWPKPDELKAFRASHPDISLVLQVGKFSLTACNNDPQRIVNQLREYGKSVEHVLLDMSMGKGKGMDSKNLLPLLRLIKSELPNLGLAVAGGLGPQRSRELEQIAREFPDISIDTQGRVKPDYAPRDSLGHLFSTDPANAQKTRAYFRHNLNVLDRS
ncbi:MAG: hypothetical protein WCW13_03235 [archaeon]|jgi:hypothetical protein